MRRRHLSIIMNEAENKNPKNDPEPEEFQENLKLVQKERDEYLNGWKRAKADLINAKKEWEEQLKSLGDYTTAEFVKQFLPVLDALENSRELAGWPEIKKLVLNVMAKNGVKEIEALGGNFDPVYHEAVAEGEGEAGRVVEVFQKGYVLNDRVIRVAKVRVGKQN